MKAPQEEVRKPFDPNLARLIEETNHAEMIVVQEELKNLHPMVASTARAVELASKKPILDRYGHVELWGHRKGPGVQIQTSLAAADRALRILDALLKALDQRGCPTRPDEDEHGREVVYSRMAGESISFSIRERVKQRRFDPKRDGKDGVSRIWQPKIVSEPNGNLVLECRLRTKRYSPTTVAWEPSKGATLEESLNKVVITAYWMIDDERRHREEARLSEIARRDAENKRLRQEKERTDEENRVRALLKQVEGWERAARIRHFVKAVREHHQDHGSAIASDSALERYLQWASQVADRFDPFVSG
jgi:hypothetical protein